MPDKPVNPACLRNQGPIEAALSSRLPAGTKVLELGSGTGQHAVFIAARRPDLVWQASEQADHMMGLQQWITEASLPNLMPPKVIDLRHWPEGLTGFDAVYTANLVHYVPAPLVAVLIAGIAAAVVPGGQVLFYGPFNENGFTSAGNAQLDAWLKDSVDTEAGLWERAALATLAANHDLAFEEAITMPSNNVMLVFKKRR